MGMSMENRSPLLRSPDSDMGSVPMDNGNEPDESELRLKSEVIKELRDEFDAILRRNEFRTPQDYVVVKEQTLKNHIDIQLRPSSAGSAMKKDYESRKTLWEKMRIALESADEFPKTATFEPGSAYEMVRVQLENEIAQRRKEPKKEKPILTANDEPIEIEKESAEPSFPEPKIPAGWEQSAPATAEIKKEIKYDPKVLFSIYMKILTFLRDDARLMLGDDFQLDQPDGNSLKFRLKDSGPRAPALRVYFNKKFGQEAIDPYFPIEIQTSRADEIVLNVTKEYKRLKKNEGGTAQKK